jgi:hypothetical protein
LNVKTQLLTFDQKIMTTSLSFSEDQLVSELWARDVRFLMGSSTSSSPLLDPANLMTALAQSADARLRLSLIPLFLRHPEFSAEAEKADWSLPPQLGQNVLRFYYTAAVFLQMKYQERLQKIFGRQNQLPDLFSSRLGVSPEKDPNQNLLQLAKRHQILSGHTINWLGTYEHAAERLIKHMEKFK